MKKTAGQMRRETPIDKLGRFTSSDRNVSQRLATLTQLMLRDRTSIIRRSSTRAHLGNWEGVRQSEGEGERSHEGGEREGAGRVLGADDPGDPLTTMVDGAAGCRLREGSSSLRIRELARCSTVQTNKSNWNAELHLQLKPAATFDGRRSNH